MGIKRDRHIMCMEDGKMRFCARVISRCPLNKGGKNRQESGCRSDVNKMAEYDMIPAFIPLEKTPSRQLSVN